MTQAYQPQPRTNEPMGISRAQAVAAAFRDETGMPCEVVRSGVGFNAVVPLEYLEHALVARGAIERRRR